MSPKKQAHLLKKYPKLLEGMTKNITESCLAFGIECGDGWYKILDAALEKIQALAPGARVSQIKEKYGTLRFYLGSANGDAFDIADMAESLSEITCETCGDPGKVRNNNGWYMTRCEKCWEKKA